MFSNSCKYAIRAVHYLAEKTENGDKLKVDDIAEALDIPKHFLAKLLQQLTKYDIVSSVKGRNGGFYLTPQNRTKNMLSLVEAIDGPVKLNECVLGLSVCSDSDPCMYHEEASKYRASFYAQLKNDSIEVSTQKKMNGKNGSIK